MAGIGNPDRPIGGLAVRTPPGVELLPLGRDHLAAAVALARRVRGLAPLDDLEPLRRRWDDLVNDVDTVGFLAADSGAVVGLAVTRLRRRLNFATFEGWISDLALAEEAPGGPIGVALVEALVAEWRLRGGHRILASVRPGDDVAREALRGVGFAEGLIEYRLAPIPQVAVAERPGVTVRPVAAGDADAVTRLIAEFGPRRSPVPDRMEAVHRTFAAHVRELDAGGVASVVAELDGVVAGVCTLEWQRPLWADELHAWIPDLVVTEPVRGRGLGRLLLAVGLRTAREAGAAEVRLESGPQRAAAQGLYRSVGFSEAGSTWMLGRED